MKIFFAWKGIVRQSVLCLLLPALTVSALAQQRPNTAFAWFNGQEVVANEVLVKFRPGTVKISRGEIAHTEDADAMEAIGNGQVFRLHSRTRSADTLLRNLKRRRDIAYAEPNFVIHTLNIPNDPHYNSLWGMPIISAPLAWDVTTGSRANVVAVIDTGVDYKHPDLAGNIWSAPRAFNVTIGGMTLTCPMGAHGFNAITNTFDPMDDNNHGTHCSGTIGAVGNDGYGICGVNWTASIMGIKFLDAAGNGTTANAVNAIEFAIQARQALGVDANIRVLSNSWGNLPFSQALLDEINKADINEMIFVAASGNNYSNNDIAPMYPASYRTHNMIVVAATDTIDGLAYFSDYGPTTVDLGAPGVGIISTTRNGGYASFNGTSMATPHVAGAAALVLALDSNLTVDQIKTSLLNNVDPIASLLGRTITGGRLNANKAVRSVVPGPNFRMDIASSPTQTVVQGATASYTIALTGANGFTDVTTLGITGLPANAVATFTPASVAGTGASTLTITPDYTTPTGDYVLTITGTSGVLTHTLTLSLAVQPGVPPDFTLDATPASQTVIQGISATYTANLTGTNGYVGTTNLSVTGLPSGATATFTPISVTGSGPSALVVTTSSVTPTGTYALTITGTSGALVHSVNVTLIVNPAPDFTLTATPASRTVERGDSVRYTLNIAAENGFTSVVNLSVIGLPTGVTAVFSPSSVTGSGNAILTIKATQKTHLGAYTLLIQGGSGALTHTMSVALIVKK